MSTESPHPPADPLEAWKAVLPSERFRVLFQEGTERRFSSPLNQEDRPGTFVCAACRRPLFRSEDKYDSGTGWPSFRAPMDPEAIETRQDDRLGMRRTEYHCRGCGGHQGHRFDDGPPPTGQRHCNNGLALEFVPDGEALPPLRSPATEERGPEDSSG